MQNRKKKRTIRLALVLGATVAGTAVIGYGGLAAWQSYTQNDGNTVAAGTLQHVNTVASACTSSSTLPVVGCATVFNVSGVSPSSASPFASGSVKVDNTGNLNSTFLLQSTASGAGAAGAPTGALCADLVLTVFDANSAVTPIYTGAMNAAVSVNLKNNAAVSSLTWTSGATAPTGSGANGNTFTFKVTPGAAFANNSADSGTSCTANFRFTQTSA